MKAYSHNIIFVCYACKYTSVDIIPALQRNILSFGYGINFKYGRLLSNSFDRFYVVTKVIFTTIKNLKFSSIDSDSECNYLNIDLDKHTYPVHYLPNIRNLCMKMVPIVYFYKKQIDFYNKTFHDILPNFPKNKKEKRGIITSVGTGFIGLTYEGISSYLHNKRQTASKKAFVAIKHQANVMRILLLG